MLRDRAEGLNRPTKVTLSVPLGTLVKIEGIAKQFHLTRKEALEEAVREWMLRREEALTGRYRRGVEKAMRESMDKRPMGQLLDDFRAQMEANGNFRPDPLTDGRGSSSVGSMQSLTLGERRKALGLSQQKLAEDAGCSVGTVRLYESGYRQQRSELIVKIEQALDEAERAAA